MDGLSVPSDVSRPVEFQDEGDLEAGEPCRVVLSPKDGVWSIEAIGVEGVRSFGRTVPAAIANIREAVGAVVDDSNALELIIGVDDEGVSAVLDRLREASRRNDAAYLARRQALEDAIEALRSFGMSYRDIGSVVGMSQQRVAQIGATGW